jgi:antitoxin MazE
MVLGITGCMLESAFMSILDSRSTVYTLYSMKTHVAKWGNSLALRLPKALTTSLSLKEGTEVELTEHAEGILLRPAGMNYELDELLKGIRPGNLHKPVETGESKGKEVW